MRHYSSFVVRRWQVPSADDRIEVEHMQTGQRASLNDLVDAVNWMAARSSEEGGANTQAHQQVDDSGTE